MSPAERRRVNVTVMVVTLGAALGCAAATPSSVPLSPPAPRVVAHELPSSSRSSDSEPEEQREEAQTLEEEPDDGDDSVSSAQRPAAAASNEDPGVTSARGASSRACEERRGPPPDCARLDGDPSCLGASLARRACESFGPLLEPDVGAAWVSCLAKPGAEAPCDSGRIVRCGLSAIAGTCTDGSFQDTCARLAKACADVAPELTGTVCEELVGSYKAEGRAKVLDCLEHGCDTGSFGACLP
jgi:hypothetical protein